MGLPRFDRAFWTSSDRLTRIGDGAIGGKAHGLVDAARALERIDPARTPRVAVRIPRATVLATDAFDAFVARNGLDGLPVAEMPDERIALAFQAGAMPTEIAGDLRALVADTHTPLAVRSSSRLEDALDHPFAGVYETKMIPNDRPDADTRFRHLVEAIKFVWASTWFRGARDYAASVETPEAERMGVILQEVLGARHGDRFYPDVSGVARSFHWWPVGRSRPEDGVVSLALGLGKTIVDGDVCWTYSPTRPKAPPPFASNAARAAGTQTRFWAVHMGPPRVVDPIAETEYLVHAELADADYDGTLAAVASTYDLGSDRLSPGTGRAGPRVVDFAPILQLGEPPLNDAVRALLGACEETTGGPVEIEFAATIDRRAAPDVRLGLLQVRPMARGEHAVDVGEDDLVRPGVLVGSRRVMGNGVDQSIRDVVYVRPDRFDAAATRAIAAEIGSINRELVAERLPYLLLGFGRWGSIDPWLGIPVQWSDIAGARVIVEATLPRMNVEPSQGSHFFHNLTSFRVSYFMIHHADTPPIDWAWLDARTAVRETEHVRRVRLDAPLEIRVDGRAARGVIRHGDGNAR